MVKRSINRLGCFTRGIVMAFVLVMGPAWASEAGDHPDLTHGHASDKIEDLMDVRADRTFFSLVVFGLLCAGLYAVGWKKIKEGLEKREQGIAKQLSDAQRASSEALAKLKEYETKLATAQTEAADLVARARKDAEAAGQRIIAEAQGEAVRQRDRALADIESAKQAALSDLAGRSTDMAFSLARRVVGRELNASDHQNLIQEALRQMPGRN